MPNARDINIDRPLRILIYGPAGAGKTFFCGTAEGLKTYVFDFDNGMATLRGRDVEYDTFMDEDLMNPTSYARFEGKLTSLLANPNAFPAQVLVIDSMTTLQETLLRNIQLNNKTLGKQTSLQEYGIFADRFVDLMSRILALKKHIVVTAHEQLLVDEQTQEIFRVPAIVGKKLAPRVPLWFDEVYHLEPDVVQGKATYRFRTIAAKRMIAKSRLALFKEVEDNLTIAEILRRVKATTVPAGAPVVPAVPAAV